MVQIKSTPLILSLSTLSLKISAESDVMQGVAGAFNSTGPGLRSSNNVKSMMYMICQRNEKCKDSLNKDDFLELLTDHGCNCYPSNLAAPSALDSKKTFFHHQYKGNVVDDLDQECQKVAASYLCMYMDHDNGSIVQATGKHGCYPGMVFDYFFNDNDELICGKKNNIDYVNQQDDCKLVSCQVEREFAYRALEIMDYDPTAWLAANSGMTGFCPAKDTGSEKKPMRDACCGEFPVRYPFNSMVRECCDDGKTANIGGCM